MGGLPELMMSSLIKVKTDCNLPIKGASLDLLNAVNDGHREGLWLYKSFLRSVKETAECHEPPLNYGGD